jgi:hypothetical protein
VVVGDGALLAPDEELDPALLVLGAFASVRQEFRIGLGSDRATRALCD